MPHQHDEAATEKRRVTRPAGGDQVRIRSRRIGILAVCLVVAGTIAGALPFLREPPDPSPGRSVERTSEPGRLDKTSGGSEHPRETPAGAFAAQSPTVSLPAVALTLTVEQFQQESERAADDLCERYPQSAEAFHVAAMAQAQFHRTAKAEELWEKCLELSPNHPQFSVNLATVAMERGDSEKAVRVLRDAVAAGGTTTDVRYNLGVALTNLGQCEEAERILEQTLESSPASGDLWVALGQVQLKLGKAPEAEASLRRAIEFGGQSAPLFFALSQACVRQGKTEDAAKFRERFSQLSAEQPINVQSRFQTLSETEARRTAVTILAESAAVHARQGNPFEAERLLLRSLAIDPASVVACRALVRLYRGAEMHSEERVVLRRLIDLQPMNEVTYLDLARVSEQLGDMEAGEAALKLAIAAHPESATPFTALAQYHLEGNRAAQARWFAQEAVRRKPTADGWRLLAATCRMMGDEKSAADALEQASSSRNHPTTPPAPRPGESP